MFFLLHGFLKTPSVDGPFFLSSTSISCRGEDGKRKMAEIMTDQASRVYMDQVLIKVHDSFVSQSRLGGVLRITSA